MTLSTEYVSMELLYKTQRHSRNEKDITASRGATLHHGIIYLVIRGQNQIEKGLKHHKNNLPTLVLDATSLLLHDVGQDAPVLRGVAARWQ